MRTDTHSTTMNVHARRSRTRLGPCFLRGWCRSARRIPCLYMLMRSALNTAMFTPICTEMKGFECGITLMMMRTRGERHDQLCTCVALPRCAALFTVFPRPVIWWWEAQTGADDVQCRAERERSAEIERQQREKLLNLTGQRPMTTESIPRRRPMSGRNYFTEKEKKLLVLEESQRPSWARIEQSYKYDWVVTRDRDLAVPVESSVLKMQTSLREKSGLALQSFSSIPSIASSRATEVEEIMKRTTPRTRLTFNVPATPDVGWSCQTSFTAAEVAHDHLVPWPLPPNSRPSAAAVAPQNGPLSPRFGPTSGRPGPGTNKNNDSREEHDAFRFGTLLQLSGQASLACRITSGAAWWCYRLGTEGTGDPGWCSHVCLCIRGLFSLSPSLFPLFTLCRFRPVWSENGKSKVSCPSYNNLPNRSQSQLVQVASAEVVGHACICVRAAFGVFSIVYPAFSE